MADDYVTLAAVKQALGGIQGGQEDAAISQAISTASRLIDNFCNDQFAADVSATARTFRVDSPRRVMIDSAAEVTQVEADYTGRGNYTVLAAGEWRAVQSDGAPDGEPFQRILSVGRGFPGGFGSGLEAGLRVTARWGWPSTPDPIVTAATIQASRLWKRVREAPFGVTGVGPDGAVVRVNQLDTEVAMMVSPYRRLRI